VLKLAGDVPGGMRRIILTAVLVLAAVVGPVGAQQQVEYDPPGDRSIDELADVYNANLDAVPGWFRWLLPRGAGAQVVIIIFADASMAADGGTDEFVLQVDERGQVVEVVDLEGMYPLDIAGDRIIISTTTDTMDAIITADDPAAVARDAYRDGSLRVESEGDFTRGVIFWMAGMFDFIIS